MFRRIVSTQLLTFAALIGCTSVPSSWPGWNLASSDGDGTDIAAIQPAAGAAGILPPLPWPQEGNCASRLLAILNFSPDERSRLDPDAATLGIMPLGAGLLPEQVDELGRELVVPVLRSPGPGQPACVVTIGSAANASPHATRHVFRTTRLTSTFPKGTRRTANPDRKLLEKKLAEARKDKRADRKSGSGEVSTGDPVLDLVGLMAGGLISGITGYFETDEVAALEAELKATDAFIEEPLLTTYKYDLTELESRRTATLILALVDMRDGTGWFRQQDITDRQLVALSDNRHPGDKTSQHGPAFRLMTSSELEIRERQTPVPGEAELRIAAGLWASTPPVALTLDDLRQPTPLTTPPARDTEELTASSLELPSADDDVADIEPAARAPAPAVATARKPAGQWRAANRSEVVAVGHDGATVAFHVSEDELIVPANALPASSIVELVYPDGMTVYGLIERRDDSSGLARLFSPRSGTPLALDLDTGGDLPDIKASARGTPVMHDGRVRGIWMQEGIILPAGSMTSLVRTNF